MGLFFILPEPGSFSSCFAAASPLVTASSQYKYAYLDPIGKIGTMSDNAKRDDLAAELWETTEEILQELGLSCPDIS